MDPEATLSAAERALGDGLYITSIEYLGFYCIWRINGGFEAERGDDRARALWNALGVFNAGQVGHLLGLAYRYRDQSDQCERAGYAMAAKGCRRTADKHFKACRSLNSSDPFEAIRILETESP